MRSAAAMLILVMGACSSSARMPEFPLEALASPHAVKCKLYFAADGTVEKYTVYVTRSAIPDWVHKLADEKLGAGQDESYEVELYADGSEVYEVRRNVGGRMLELSVRRDRTILYIERQIDEKDLIEAVRAALRGLPNFSPERYAYKESAGFGEYNIRGKIGETPYRVRIRPDGTLVAVQKQLPGSVEIITR